MKSRPIPQRLVVAILFVAAAMSGCSAMLLGGGESKSPGVPTSARSASDQVITRQVRSALADEPLLMGYSIGVYAAGGTVRLSGTVGSFDARDKAVSVTREIDGVRLVDNQIRVNTRQ